MTTEGQIFLYFLKLGKGNDRNRVYLTTCNKGLLGLSAIINCLNFY